VSSNFIYLFLYFKKRGIQILKKKTKNQGIQNKSHAHRIFDTANGYLHSSLGIAFWIWTSQKSIPLNIQTTSRSQL
jgi:hypothetical protein